MMKSLRTTPIKLLLVPFFREKAALTRVIGCLSLFPVPFILRGLVWKLDRLGRLLKDLIETLNLLKSRGVDFISLTESIDTTTPSGKLIFHLMGALAEFERDLIRERTNAGLAAARARGRIGGRPKRLATNGKVALARRLFADPNHSIPEICSTLGISRSTLGISRSTLYRYVRETAPSASES